MDINFLERFFGVTFNQTGRYIDQTRQLLPIQSQIWGKKDAIWIDTTDSWRLFLEIPELRTVINKRASMMSTNIPCLYDKDGNKVENHWLLDLIAHPNAVQSWSDVVYSLSVQDALYSNSFAYAPVRSFGVRNLMVPLPASKVKIHTTGKRLNFMDADDLIDKFTFRYDDNTDENIPWIDMIYLTTDDGMNIIKPVSRIDTLKYPLSNIRAQYHKRNVLLENIGAIGILSAQQNDLGGAIPMTPEEKTTIQRDWYRRQKDELIITEAQVNWQPMSFPTKDLMLFEELSADKLAIIDTYGMNANIFSSDKGSTFDNVRESIKMVYQDTIIPETQAMYDSLMHQFGLDKEGYYLIADFSHLPILQDDEQMKATAIKTQAEGYSILVKDGILTPEHVAQEFGVEILKPDPREAQLAGLINAQTELRGTVGGLNGIIAINTAVSTNQMSRETGVNTLVNYYGYERVIAETMITAKPEIITANNTQI
jgi:hypothetical protein